jgi:hypothetical protein
MVTGPARENVRPMAAFGLSSARGKRRAGPARGFGPRARPVQQRLGAAVATPRGRLWPRQRGGAAAANGQRPSPVANGRGAARMRTATIRRKRWCF